MLLHSVQRPSAGEFTVWICVLVFLANSTGCAHSHSIFELESQWDVPYPSGERPSPLWTADPRTKGWNGVHVSYLLYEWGDVKADVISLDDRHQFTAQGKYWEFLKRSDADPYGYLIVDFDGKKERYRFGTNPDRAIIMVEEPAPELKSP